MHIQDNSEKNIVNLIYELYKQKLYESISNKEIVKVMKRKENIGNFLWRLLLATIFVLILGYALSWTCLMKLGLLGLVIVFIIYIIWLWYVSKDNKYCNDKNVIRAKIEALDEVISQDNMGKLVEEIEFNNISLKGKIFSKISIAIPVTISGVWAVLNTDNPKVNNLINTINTKIGNWDISQIGGSIVFFALAIFMVVYFFDLLTKDIKDSPYEKWGELQSIYALSKYGVKN